MKINSTILKIKGFTILEVLMAVAIISILISVFFGAMNRYGEQLKQEVEIKNELNYWFMMRSELWKEFDQADSLTTVANECTFHIKSRRIIYSIRNERLVRNENGAIQELNVGIKKIENFKKGIDFFTIFNFDWKNEELKLIFPRKKLDLSNINNYFINKEWK